MQCQQLWTSYIKDQSGAFFHDLNAIKCEQLSGRGYIDVMFESMPANNQRLFFSICLLGSILGKCLTGNVSVPLTVHGTPGNQGRVHLSFRLENGAAGQGTLAASVSNLADSMATNILGISAFYHDSAAALIQDGEIVAAAQEERFTRRKHDPGFPRNAISYCRSEAGINVSDIDYVVFYERPFVKFERILETSLAYVPRGFESFRRAMPSWAKLKLRLPERIQTELGSEFRGQICFVEHHESHAASAFFPSPFEEAAILTLDAVGEWATSSIGHRKRKSHYGGLRDAFSAFSGNALLGVYLLHRLQGEFRGIQADGACSVWSAASTSTYIRKRSLKVMDDGSLWLDMSYFNYCQGMTMTSEKFHELFGGPPRESESFITQKEMDLAASIQAVCEEVVLRAGRTLIKLTGQAKSGHGRRSGPELRGERSPAARRPVRKYLDTTGGGRCRRRARSGLALLAP